MRTKLNYIRIDLIIFFIALTLLTSLLLYNRQIKEQRYHRFWEGRLRADYNAALSDKQQMARLFFDTVISRPEIVEMIRAVRSAHEAGKPLPSAPWLRQVTDYMREYHFDQIRFYLPGHSDSFLVLSSSPTHGADKFGNEDSGFKTGLFFRGFSHIFSLADSAGEISTVQICLSFNTIRADLKNSYPAEYAFIVKKDAVGNVVTDNRYAVSDLSDLFLREKMLPQGAVHQSTDDRLPDMIRAADQKIRTQVADDLEALNAFSIGTSAGGREYMINFIPISGIGGQKAAYLISYRADDTLRAFRQNFLLTWGFITALMVFLMVVHLRSTRQLQAANYSLREVNEQLARQVKTRQDTEQQLAEAREKLEGVSRTSQDALMMTDEEGRIRYWNPGAVKLFGRDPDEVRGKLFYDLLTPERHRQKAKEGITAFAKTGKGESLDKTIVSKALRRDKSEFLAEVTTTAIRIDDQWWAVASVRDVSKIRDMEHQLAELSTTDPFTGLFNRRHFLKLAGREFTRCRRYNRALSLIVMDIDGFRAINHANGHKVGDDVLNSLADIARHNVRSIDIPARLEGGELAVLLPDTDLKMACVAAERFRDFVERTDVPSKTPNQPVSFTVSIGVATVSSRTTDVEALLKDADSALCRAKQNGRNRVLSYSEKGNMMHDARSQEDIVPKTSSA